MHWCIRMVMHHHAKLLMVMSNCEWLCMTMCTHTELCMITYDYERRCPLHFHVTNEVGQNWSLPGMSLGVEFSCTYAWVQNILKIYTDIKKTTYLNMGDVLESTTYPPCRSICANRFPKAPQANGGILEIF